MSRSRKKVPKNEGQEKISEDLFESIAAEVSAVHRSRTANGVSTPKLQIAFRFQGPLFKVEGAGLSEGLSARRTADLATLAIGLLFAALIVFAWTFG